MKEYRVSKGWLWFATIVCPPVALGLFAVAFSGFLVSDPNSTQTVGQKIGSFLIFAILGAAVTLAPWVAWTGRLSLSDTGIKFKYGFRTREIPKEQIRSFSTGIGLKLGMVRVMPRRIELYAKDKRLIARIPGYFEGRDEFLSWLQRAI